MMDKVGGVLLSYIYLFKFIGFAPINLGSKVKSQNILLLLWPVLIIVSLDIFMLTVFINSSAYLFVEEHFALFNDYLKISTTIVSINVSFWQSLLMRNHEQQFWNLYITVRSSRNPPVKDLSVWEQLCEHRTHIFKFLFIMTLYVALYIIYICFRTEERAQVLNFWIMYTPYTLVICLRNMQFIVYISLIRIELEALDQELGVLVELTEWERTYGSFNGFDDFIQRRISEKRRIYQWIFEMSENFQMATNWSMVLQVISGYVRVLVDCYFFLWTASANILPLIPVQCATAIMEANICTLVRWHLKAFRLCAFLPISLSADSKRVRIEEFLWKVWGLIVVTLYNFLLIGIFQQQSKNPIYQNDIFGYSIECIKMSITSLAIDIYILEPLFKKNKHRSFWELYSQLSQNRRLMPLKQQMLEYKWFLLKFYGYSCIILFVDVVIVVCIRIPVVWFFLIHFTTTYLLKMQTLHMILSVELVKVEIQNLEKDLKLLVEYTEFGQCRYTFSKFDEFIRTHIHQKQKTYECIFEMLQSFKDACGISIMANYVKNYIHLLTSLYWLYWRCYVRELSVQDVLLITAVLEIPLFLMTAKSCMNAAKYISYRVHNIKRSDDNVATSIQIQNFSLQLLHQKIKIDGLGIASMDGYMLTKAVGSITTYMIFFIQFMPKFKSKFE